MSLLLDALKKAADDKQKISRGEFTGPIDGLQTEQNATSSASDKIQPLAEELSLQPVAYREPDPEILSVNDVEDLAELTLDIDNDYDDASANSNEDGGLTNVDTGTGQHEQLNSDIDDKKSANENGSDNRKFKISDDALSMLVYKTNRDVKKDKFIVVVSLLIASLLILLSGGIYFYMDAQSEIAAIERRHQIAMQSMHSKTSKENTSKDLEVIRNLVSDAALDEKVQFAKQHIANKKNPARNNLRRTESKVQPVAKTSNTRAATPGLSIHKTNKTDPVAEKLDTAWLAYESGNFNEAKNLYKGVLNVESDNRDAMLGLGAIAVVEKDSVAATKIYSLLLNRNPSDPIATAALAGLRNNSSLHESDEEYLLSLLRKNPDAPHLNFSLANIYAQNNKWKSAQQYYFNAWQHDTENPDYIFNLAVSMDQLSKRQQAMNFYKDSLVKSVNKQVSFSRDAVQKRIRELSGL